MEGYHPRPHHIDYADVVRRWADEDVVLSSDQGRSEYVATDGVVVDGVLTLCLPVLKPAKLYLVRTSPAWSKYSHRQFRRRPRRQCA